MKVLMVLSSVIVLLLLSPDYNFSHRIDHLSFGDQVSGIIYPLDGTEITTTFSELPDHAISL